MKIFLSIGLGIITGLLWIYWLMLPAEAKEEVKEEIVQYKTDRETHLYNKVEKTVDLPWFWDYQDLLASYAYNTCKKVISDTGKYSCENLVKTWNAENWWWKWNATNTANKNGTHDWWLCQLNSAYHLKFIKSERFENPLAQLDYCLQVRVDAKNKGKMPWYAYNVRHKRDRGITFKGSNAGIVTHKQAVLNYYAKAVEATKTRQTLYEQLEKAKVTEVKARGDCIENKQCDN